MADGSQQDGAQEEQDGAAGVLPVEPSRGDSRRKGRREDRAKGAKAPKGDEGSSRRRARRSAKPDMPDAKGAESPRDDVLASGGDKALSGLGAFRVVRAASKQHADAQDRAKQVKAQLDQERKDLAHRDQVDRDFAQIVQAQTAGRDKARAEAERAGQEVDRLAGEQAQLEAQLEAMRADHEEALRPYRELMETAKGRSDDAARALADARRAVKSADAQAQDSTKRRDQSISDANRAVDNAQDRLRKVQAELTNLQSDPKASPAARSKMGSELVTEQAHLDAAKDEVKRVTEEAQRNVEAAQSRLWSLRQKLDDADGKASAAKAEADARREEYEGMHNEALSKEKALSDEIARRKSAGEAADRSRQNAQQNASAAQALLDEANDIHANPEVTAKLRAQVAQDQAELDAVRAEVAHLARREKTLRARTRGQRVGIVAGTVVALAVVVVLVVMFVLPH